MAAVTAIAKKRAMMMPAVPKLLFAYMQLGLPCESVWQIRPAAQTEVGAVVGKHDPGLPDLAPVVSMGQVVMSTMLVVKQTLGRPVVGLPVVVVAAAAVVVLSDAVTTTVSTDAELADSAVAVLVLGLAVAVPGALGEVAPPAWRLRRAPSTRVSSSSFSFRSES